MIVIINYGMGNLGSIANMIKKVGGTAVITSDLDVISAADKIILPGVGSFDRGMQNLKEHDMIKLLNYKVLEKKTPVLGICLGMQLLSEGSEEGQLPGLGWIKAKTVKFQSEQLALKVPHMGWNFVRVVGSSSLTNDMYDNSKFYFVHSYHVVCDDRDDVLMETNYGIEFTSSIHRDNIYGVQFHPEKSHKFGMKLMKNFVELVSC